jgi:aspartyl-tRNA(Asn)/glutamyl-tRNA(Gln) amidotransferase subunit C
MIPEDEVQHIAKLARIHVSPEDIKKFQKELGEVLEYFEIIKDIDVNNVVPMTHSVLLENIKREDIAKSKSRPGKELIDMAPEQENGYLKVKSIL